MPDASQTLNVPVWLPVIGTLGATLITGVIAFSINLVNKRSEERKHKQQLIIQAALANWNRDFEIAKEHQKSGSKARISPLDIYLIHQMNLIEALTDSKLTATNLTQKLQSIEDITSATIEWYKQNDRNNKQH